MRLGLLSDQPPFPGSRTPGRRPAHTAGQIISVVTVETADRSSAVAVALAVVSEALRRPAVSPNR
jgi:hypothetical protein